MNIRHVDTLRTTMLTLAALILTLTACTTPSGTPSATARLDTLTPTTGGPGTQVEITGRIPAGATLHLCDVPLTDLQLSDPETAAATHFTRATGTVPALTPGVACTLTVVLGDETLPHTGGTHTFTTDEVVTDDARLDTLTPTTGTPGTQVEITGRIPAGATLHLCDAPLDDLQLSDPETAAATHFTRATGTVPALAPGTACALTIVRDGQTLPHTGATLTFTTDAGAPAAPAAPTNLSATTGNATLAITFTLPNDGGSPITALEYSLDGATWSPAATTTSPLQLAGLPNEQPITARLRVWNAAGISPASEPITATPTLWPFANGASGTSVQQAHSVSTLEDGSAIITGYYEGSATFGATTFTSAGSRDVFVAKTNPDGSWAWATSAGGTFSDEARGVSALADGSAIITGYYQRIATFGDTTLPITNVLSHDVFVAKTNPDGSWAWATSAGGLGNDMGFAVSALADGSAIITGRFRNTATFGDTTLTSAGGLGDDFDVFVAKTNADGTWAWATQAGGTLNDTGFAVSALADGSAIITGHFQSTATFGTTTLTGAGFRNVFVAKTNPDGSWAWATSVGGTGDDEGMSVSALADGSAIITGYFEGTTTFGATTLTSAGSDDVFVAKTNPDGSWAWAYRAGGTFVDDARGVSALADGSAIITGYFNGTATFGATTLSSAGGNDVFVAKVSTDSAW